MYKAWTGSDMLTWQGCSSFECPALVLYHLDTIPMIAREGAFELTRCKVEEGSFSTLD